MPKAGHDYDKAKGMLLKGLTIKQISDETGIPYGSLQRHALRHGWRTDQTRVQTLVSETVNDRLQKQCVAWVMSIAEKADRTLEALGNYDFAGQVHKLKPNEWVQALATLNNIARQNYGLDAGNAASPRVQVQVQVLTQAAQSLNAFDSDVIDLEPAPRLQHTALPAPSVEQTSEA